MDHAMDRVGFSTEEKNNIYRVIAAVLHLGNIAFQEEESTQGTSCNNESFIYQVLRWSQNQL